LEVETIVAPDNSPIRTCIGCRRTAPQTRLIRVVAAIHAGQLRVHVDEERKLPGRGAWLHSDQNCINHAITRRAFNRAFRKAGAIDVSELIEWSKHAVSNFK